MITRRSLFAGVGMGIASSVPMGFAGSLLWPRYAAWPTDPSPAGALVAAAVTVLLWLVAGRLVRASRPRPRRRLGATAGAIAALVATANGLWGPLTWLGVSTSVPLLLQGDKVALIQGAALGPGMTAIFALSGTVVALLVGSAAGVAGAEWLPGAGHEERDPFLGVSAWGTASVILLPATWFTAVMVMVGFAPLGHRMVTVWQDGLLESTTLAWSVLGFAAMLGPLLAAVVLPTRGVVAALVGWWRGRSVMVVTRVALVQVLPFAVLSLVLLIAVPAGLVSLLRHAESWAVVTALVVGLSGVGAAVVWGVLRPWSVESRPLSAWFTVEGALLAGVLGLPSLGLTMAYAASLPVALTPLLGPADLGTLTVEDVQSVVVSMRRSLTLSLTWSGFALPLAILVIYGWTGPVGAVLARGVATAEAALGADEE